MRDRTAERLTYIAAGLTGAFIFTNEANLKLGGSFDWQDMLRVLTCCCCGLFGLISLPRTIGQFGRFPGAFVALFGIWACLTIPFAGDPMFGAISCVTLCTTLIFAPAALYHLGAEGFAKSATAGLLAVILGSWVIFFFFPSLAFKSSLGETFRFAGLNHPNTTAGQATMIIGFLAAFYLECRTPWQKVVLPVALCVLTLVMCMSRTNFVTAFVVVAMLVVPRKYFIYCALIVFSLMSGYLLMVGVGVISVEDQLQGVTRSGDVAELYTLVGRVDRWREAIELIHHSPIMGFGHGCARFSAEGHSHNLWLNVALTTGIVGLMLVNGMIVPLGVNLVTRPNSFADVIFMYVFLRGLTTSPLFNPIPGSASLLFVIAVFWRQMGMSLRSESTGDEKENQ